MIGNRIREYIETAGYDKALIAQRCCIPYPDFLAALDGARAISDEEYLRIVAALGLPPDYFSTRSAD